MNNAFLVVPGWNCPISIEHTTTPVRVPTGCTDVRFSLVSAQPMRDRPQFGAVLQVWWTDELGRTPVKRDLWKSEPKQSWTPEEIEEGLPISGHAVGEVPGIVPHDVGPFAYEVEGSPAVDSNDRPDGYDRVFLKYTVLGGNNGSPVYLSVVLEAFHADISQGIFTPLEFG